jgi:hypothetical protein
VAEEKPELKLLSEAIQESINISDRYEHDEKGLVTKWIVIAEVAQADGNTSLFFRAPATMLPWETEGLLSFILSKGSYRNGRPRRK